MSTIGHEYIRRINVDEGSQEAEACRAGSPSTLININLNEEHIADLIHNKHHNKSKYSRSSNLVRHVNLRIRLIIVYVPRE